MTTPEPLSKRHEPKSPEHRAKISAALKRYAARPDAHLHAFHGAGDAHPNWKGGVAPRTYQRIAYEAHGTDCLHCGVPSQMVHHVDHDRKNNVAANLAPLCYRCHANHHHGVRVPWQCPICGIVLYLRPFEARARRICSKICKEATRDERGIYREV